MEVKFVKVRDNAVLPYKKHTNDAGYDLTWAPESKEIQRASKIVEGNVIPCDGLEIPPGNSVLLKTGLKALFPEGYVLEVKNRSGVAAKRGLLVGACIVDSTYRGEIFVNLHNVSNKVQCVENGERIAQCVFYRVENIIATEISENEYANFETSRGNGALGSTGMKNV